MMIRYEPHERVTAALLSEISSSLFEFFYFNSGGAISISNSDYSLSLKSSLFRFCIATSYGGAIYLSGRQISSESVCFDTCYNTGATDNVFGNGIYSKKEGQLTGTSFINFTSFFGCGPAGELAGDSTIYLEEQSLESEDINFTRCSGSGGSTSLTLNRKPGRSKYISTYGGFASHLTAVDMMTLTFQNINFLNFSQNKKIAIFYGNSKTIEITNCVLFITTIMGELGSVSFKGSYFGNIEIPGFGKSDYTEFLFQTAFADGYCQKQGIPLISMKSKLGKLNKLVLVIGFLAIYCTSPRLL